jgi:hypothetical protein
VFSLAIGAVVGLVFSDLGWVVALIAGAAGATFMHLLTSAYGANFAATFEQGGLRIAMPRSPQVKTEDTFITYDSINSFQRTRSGFKLHYHATPLLGSDPAHQSYVVWPEDIVGFEHELQRRVRGRAHDHDPEDHLTENRYRVMARTLAPVAASLTLTALVALVVARC